MAVVNSTVLYTCILFLLLSVINTHTQMTERGKSKRSEVADVSYYYNESMSVGVSGKYGLY